jgi:site-specific recombinase XerD
MSSTTPLGPILHSFFVDHLITVKGLRPASVRSYRDTVRLLIVFVAADRRCKITRLMVEDLTFDRVVRFLRHLETDRGNHTRTRNQRLAALHCLFGYIAGRDPEMLAVCQQVAAIPMKRVAPAETRFLEQDEVEDLLRHLPRDGRLALRDRALLLFLYNTGARVQEVADLRIEHLHLGEHPLVRLHGKGDKWRTCPLWQQTAKLLAELLQTAAPGPPTPHGAVFAAHGLPLTRSGIYKIVRRHGAYLDDLHSGRRVSPHTFRHTAAVHLLEAGVEVNVIRGWLGHADLTTTNRYAEINTKTKLAALRACEPPGTSAESRANPIWRTDETLLNWLASL